MNTVSKKQEEEQYASDFEAEQEQVITSFMCRPIQIPYRYSVYNKLLQGIMK